MSKKKPPYNKNAAIRSAIRRTFSRSPVVREVMMEHRREIPKFNKDGTRAKKDAVQYQCNVCNQWVGSSYIAVDHIEPVIEVEGGFQDWNTFVDRLFCDKDNLQCICDECHQKKTNKERFDRSFLKDSELLKELTDNFIEEVAKKFCTKFTAKKLQDYPKDFQDKVMALKEKLRGIKNEKRKTREKK